MHVTLIGATGVAYQPHDPFPRPVLPEFEFEEPPEFEPDPLRQVLFVVALPWFADPTFA